jgi:hypothetical protein
LLKITEDKKKLIEYDQLNENKFNQFISLSALLYGFFRKLSLELVDWDNFVLADRASKISEELRRFLLKTRA